MAQSGKQTERLTASALPLTPRLQAIVASLLEAIDARHHTLDDLASDEHHIRRCTGCNGTGVNLIPVFSVPDEEDEGSVSADVTQTPAVDESRPSAIPDAAPVNLPIPVFTAVDLTTASEGGGDPVSEAPTPATVATSDSDQEVGAGVNLPAISVPIAGLNPMPIGTPTPRPEDALYSGPGATRYYSITRGRRLGIYAGWESTTPYVTGVGGACFSKFNNVYEAYHAYVVAYERGLTAYL